MPVLSRLLDAGRRVSRRPPPDRDDPRGAAPATGADDRAAEPVHGQDPAQVRARHSPPRRGRLAQPRRAPGPASWETRPDRPSPQSQSLSRSYGSGLPTSLTYIVLFGQRLFTLETCCGYRYDNQARVRQDVLHSPGFSRADRSSPDAAAGATFSGATGPYLRKNHSPGRHMLLK